MAEKLLIVDDEADTLRLVSLMLERQGYEVTTAEDGVTALECVKNEIPDLILLDVMMPDLDGFEVARQLRSKKETEDVPIIMFTAKTQVEDKITGLESGADVYLTKPTQPRELFAQVKAVLARSKKSRTTEILPVTTTDHGYTIGVLAAKGGMGVSTMVINLGIIIHRQTKDSVLIAELQPGSGGISLDLGYSNPDGLNRLLQSPINEITASAIEKALISHTSGVQILLASPHPKDAILNNNIENFEVITSKLPLLASFIVIDLGSSLPSATQTTLSVCDEVIVIMEPSPNNVYQTRELIRNLIELGIGEGRMRVALVNRIRSSVQLNWTQIQDDLGYKIATVFTPAPELAYQSSANNVPMVLAQPGSITTQQFEKLAILVTQRKQQDI
jgi:CheY-like chemotaxis protein/MinD-like ATPase involved in chromosome partitioning or flagellar assembly